MRRLAWSCLLLLSVAGCCHKRSRCCAVLRPEPFICCTPGVIVSQPGVPAPGPLPPAESVHPLPPGALPDRSQPREPQPIPEEEPPLK